jgi:diguanylate cyclase (GGDEF)-like protein
MAAEQISEGYYDTELDYDKQDEVGVLTASFKRLISNLNVYIRNLNDMAYIDALTGIGNRLALRRDYDSYQGHEVTVMMVDLDNFKAVNDTLGHMYGDAVLTQISTTLRNLFRAQDVIGRIGGDEFLILLKNIPGRELVEDRCRLVVDTFREQLHRLMPNLPVSVSVGAALSPAHGTTYADLFRHADEALYTAKRNGKCQFHVYDVTDALAALSAPQSNATRIDSDEQPSMTNEAMMRYVFQQLYESRDLDATINSLLTFIGSHFNVSRVYIFENNEDNTCCSNTFEWCNAGIQPEKDNLQNLSYETDLAGWPEVYGETGILYCADISELEPHIREIVEPQGIKSMLHCAIMDRGVFRGYVGFDECTATCLWTQGQVDTLKILAEMMAVFLVKQRASDKK